MSKETIRDYNQRILGTIETKPNGDKVVRSYDGKVLGFYKKSDNTTRDFYMRILAKGDQTSMLLSFRR